MCEGGGGRGGGSLPINLLQNDNRIFVVHKEVNRVFEVLVDSLIC